MAIFSVYLTIPLIGAVVMSLPFVLFFFGQFVAPALKKNEKTLLVPGFIAGVVLFLSGGLALAAVVLSQARTINVHLGSVLFGSITTGNSRPLDLCAVITLIECLFSGSCTLVL